MLHSNNTPFSALGFEQTHRDGPVMAVIAVRGAFVFADSGHIVLAEKQAMVLGEEFDGGYEMKGSAMDLEENSQNNEKVTKIGK